MLLFFDRTFSKQIARALNYLRPPTDLEIRTHYSMFPGNTPDEVWLEQAGRDGWVVLTLDRRQLIRPNERSALRFHGAGAFYFTAIGNATTWIQGLHVIRALPRLLDLADVTPRPFAFLVSKSGRFRLVDITSQ